MPQEQGTKGTRIRTTRIGFALVAALCIVVLAGACGGSKKGGGSGGGLLSNTDPQNKDCETAINTNPITVKDLQSIAEENGLDPAVLLAKIKEICQELSISSPVDKAIKELKPTQTSALPPADTTTETTTVETTTEAPPAGTTTPETTTGGTDSGSGESYCYEADSPDRFEHGCQGYYGPPPSGTG